MAEPLFYRMRVISKLDDRGWFQTGVISADRVNDDECVKLMIEELTPIGGTPLQWTIFDAEGNKLRSARL